MTTVRISREQYIKALETGLKKIEDAKHEVRYSLPVLEMRDPYYDFFFTALDNANGMVFRAELETPISKLAEK